MKNNEWSSLLPHVNELYNKTTHATIEMHPWVADFGQLEDNQKAEGKLIQELNFTPTCQQIQSRVKQMIQAIAEKVASKWNKNCKIKNYKIGDLVLARVLYYSMISVVRYPPRKLWCQLLELHQK